MAHSPYIPFTELRHAYGTGYVYKLSYWGYI